MIPQTTMLQASLEIGAILAGAFILGVIFGRITLILGASDDGEDVGEEVKKPLVQKKKLSTSAPKTKKLQDDFRLIEGIGPKIEALLREHGVHSYADIVREDVLGLEVILMEGGKKFAAHNPVTWPDQARLAMQGRWSELEEYQKILNSKQD